MADRHEAGRANAARLPRHLGPAADRQGRQTARSRRWFSSARQPHPLTTGPLGSVQPATIGIRHTHEIPRDPRAVSGPRNPAVKDLLEVFLVFTAGI